MQILLNRYHIVPRHKGKKMNDSVHLWRSLNGHHVQQFMESRRRCNTSQGETRAPQHAARHHSHPRNLNFTFSRHFLQVDNWTPARSPNTLLGPSWLYLCGFSCSPHLRGRSLTCAARPREPRVASQRPLQAFYSLSSMTYFLWRVFSTVPYFFLSLCLLRSFLSLFTAASVI